MPLVRSGRRRPALRAVLGAAALALPLAGGLVGAAQAAPPDRLAPAGPAAAAATFDPRPGVAVGPVGDYAADIAVSPSGNRALVVSDGYLAQLDVTTDQPKVIGRNEAISGGDVAYHPSGTTAYVLDGEQLTVVDTSGAVPRPVRALHGITPSSANAITVSRDGRWAYVAYGELGGPSGVKVLSVATPRQPVVKKTLATAPLPVDVDLSPRGDRLVVVYSLVDEVGLFDVSTPTSPKTVVRELQVPFSPGATVFSPDGSTVYVWGDDDAKVGTISWTKRLVTRTRSVGGYAGGPDAVLSPDGRYLFAVTDQGSDEVGAVVVDTSTLAPVTSFTGLDYSRGLAQSPGGPSAGRTFFLSSGSNVYGTRSHVYPVLRKG